MIHRQLTAADSGAATTVEGKVNTTAHNDKGCAFY